MCDKKKSLIDWSEVLTKCVTYMVVAIVAGACAIVWKGATTVDVKIYEAKAEAELQRQALQETVEYVRQAIDKLENESIGIQERHNELILQMNELVSQMEDLMNNIDDKPDRNRKTYTHKLLKPSEVPKDNYIQQTLPNMPVFDKLEKYNKEDR